MDLKIYILTQGRGCARRLAKELKISPSYLSQMATGLSPISPKRCVEIELATNGLVTRKDLCADWADIWPELLNNLEHITQIQKTCSCTEVQE